MKHFEQPLTAFAHGMGSESESRQEAGMVNGPSMCSLREALATRIWAEASPQSRQLSGRAAPDYLNGSNWENPEVENLLEVVQNALQDIRHQASRMRLAYRLFRCVQCFMRARGYKTLTSATGEEDSGLAFMSRFMRGRVSRDVKHLALMIKYVYRLILTTISDAKRSLRKLPGEQLDSLLSEMYSLFYSLQIKELRQQEAHAREFLVQSRTSIPEDASAEPDGRKKTSAVSGSVSEWFASYIECVRYDEILDAGPLTVQSIVCSDRATRIDQKPLWELWNTGTTPFPSEVHSRAFARPR